MTESYLKHSQSGNVKSDPYADIRCHIMNQKYIHECRVQTVRRSLCHFQR